MAVIDLHSHILPELDDGASSLAESLDMARLAAESGVTAMVATPHCADDRAREVYSAWKMLKGALEEMEIPVKLYLGMELYGTEDTLRLLKEGKAFTLNGSRYPLVEFDFHSDGELETRILRGLIRGGYRPVVAHPERYIFLQQEPEILNDWSRMGCLFQVNRGSLLGRFGRTARDFSMALVDRGFAFAVASDAHSVQYRTPWMADVKELLEEEFSWDAARYLLYQNPKSILNNADLPPVEPEWF